MEYGLFAHPTSMNVMGIDAVTGTMYSEYVIKEYLERGGAWDAYTSGCIAKRCNAALAYKLSGIR